LTPYVALEDVSLRAGLYSPVDCFFLGTPNSFVKPSAEHKRELASMVHLCDAGAAKSFAQRGFRLAVGERCGDHDVANYLARVKAMEREFLHLAASQ
jgi:hypothetical protein